MKVYDAKGLQKALGIGRDAAYKILQEHGFLIGEKTRRITDEQIRRMTKDAERSLSTPDVH